MIERDGELLPAVVNMPLVQGDRLRTENGRVQILFPDGSAIDVDQYSDIEFVTDTRIRVIAGSIERGAAPPVYATSTPYLPAELQTYGNTFDQYGAWQYAAPYGYVWCPRVAVGWRPYYDGYWSPLRAYGWTWIGLERWSWPTHHYGRWGFASGTWFWIPGRAFAPAWVSWAVAADYVSWCPLGFDSSPVFAMTVGHGNPWPGWTVVRRDIFAARDAYIPHYAVDHRQLPERAPFIVQQTAPVAVLRQSSVASLQLPVIGRQSPVVSPQSPLLSHQLPVVNPQSPAVAVPRAQAPSLVREPVRPMPTYPRPTSEDSRPTPVIRRPMSDDSRPAIDERRLMTVMPRAVAPVPAAAAVAAAPFIVPPRAIEPGRAIEHAPATPPVIRSAPPAPPPHAAAPHSPPPAAAAPAAAAPSGRASGRSGGEAHRR